MFSYLKVGFTIQVRCGDIATSIGVTRGEQDQVTWNISITHYSD